MLYSSLVRDFLESSARRTPAKTALVCEGGRYSFADLDSAANRLANTLIEHGVQRGDRVAICLPNSAEALISIFAVAKASAAFVPINHGTKPDKLAGVLNNCTPRVFITDATHAAVAAPSVEMVVCVNRGSAGASPHQGFTRGSAGASPHQGWPHRGITFERALESQDTAPARRNIDLDLACLIYTSGSTGEPKGVMSDHANIAFVSASIIDYLANDDNDVVLNVLPLSFCYGLYQALMTVRFGGTLVLENSFAYPAPLLQRMEKERVTGLPGVPTLFAMLLKMDLRKFNLSSLRYLTNAGAALSPAHLDQIREAIPHARFFSMYGLTEAKRVLYLPPEWLDRKPTSVGIPIPGTEAWLEDENGRRVGANTVGELIVRGRHVMRGYWNDPELTANRFTPGPLPGERLCRTGDLFRMDEDGFFYFVARKDDIIKSRGEKVAPREVENVLYAIPGVTEAAVFGVPDSVLGQSIKAVIATDGRPLTAAEVIAHCRQRLEDFMVPKQVEFCTALPKTASGKIRKSELKCVASPESAI